MTTWTANDKNKIRSENLGNSIAQTFTIAAVNGNTGGTLTCSNFKTIDNVAVTGWRVTGPTVLAITGKGRISGKTVVVAHTNPGENATVKVKVWGRKG